jgi:ribonuclease BN (tRNA processing enzyme)
MKVSCFGTRGSIPISRPDSIKFGGNTTCLLIGSEALPADHWLVVDAGTGIVPLGNLALKQDIKKMTILSTHWHHDHTQGALLCPMIFSKDRQINWYGPIENGIGPKQVLENLMKPPYFPVDFAEVASHFTCKAIDHPGGKVIAIHPRGGIKLMTIEELERFEAASPQQLPFGKSRHAISECLIVRMLKTNHPERTVSYRFEERSTGKVFVFLTDHENTDGLPKSLCSHLENADLLIMDSQYSRQKYDGMTAGFGHGTPDYCALVARQVGAKRLGLTHHDPASNDTEIEAILSSAKECLGDAKIEAFACADYMELEV